MSVYRYYLPNVKPAAVTDDMLTALGLAERLRDCPMKTKGNRIEVNEIIDHGPDGGNGALIVPQPADRKGARSYNPTEFASHKSEQGDYWIVWDKLNPPTPEGLQRWETVSGVVCELGDGRLWECPTIRTCIRWPRVPQSYSRINGELLTSVLSPYEDVWNKSRGWSVRLLEEYRDVPVVRLLGLEGAFDAAVKCLAVNYRIDDEEASFLNLLNDRTLDEIIDAAVDAAFVGDIDGDQKKTECWTEASQDLRNFLRGSEDLIADTNQAEET